MKKVFAQNKIVREINDYIDFLEKLVEIDSLSKDKILKWEEVFE